VANPTGLEWHNHQGNKWYAMCEATIRRPINRGGMVSAKMVFGRVERDGTGRIVASATSFDHVKYVDSIEDGKLHVEAIWALEHSSSADGK